MESEENKNLKMVVSILERVRIENLEPGQYLAQSIYSPDGKVLLRQRTEMSPTLISRLRELRLPSAYITRSINECNDHELVSELTRSDLLQSLSKLDSEIRSGREFDFSFCRKPLFTLVDEVISHRKNLLGLTDIRLFNDYIYGHSVHVCIIAVKTALEMGYEESELTDLAVGALFHDIGMTQIPYDVLRRVGHLSKDELKIIQAHPKTGFEMLGKNQDISTAAAYVAFQHHEQYNGGGYPLGLRGKEIHQFARIITVADVYDAMTTEKPYRPARTSADALAYLKTQQGIAYDPEVVEVFEQIVNLKFS